MESEALEVFERRRFPKVKAPGILIGRNQGEIDARDETKYSGSGELVAAVLSFVEKVVVLLTSLSESRKNLLWI